MEPAPSNEVGSAVMKGEEEMEENEVAVEDETEGRSQIACMCCVVELIHHLLIATNVSLTPAGSISG